MIGLHFSSRLWRHAGLEEGREIRVALAGNPNAGKTSLFNALTGARQRVGNYPGVTVEKRQGRYVGDDGAKVELVDLPGAYSLSSGSAEERIAQRELLGGAYDAVVVVVDSTTLKRSLVLLAQIMQMGAHCVLCLNMCDEAAAAGQQLDLERMRALLGVPIVQTVGHRADGVAALREAIAEAIETPAAPERVILGDRLDRALAAVGAELEIAGPRSHRRWLAGRLLVGDDNVSNLLEAGGVDAARASAEAQRWRKRLEAETGLDIALFITERTFGFVDGLLREVVLRRARADARVWSDRVDSVIAHRVLGIPIFALIMYAVFWVTFTLGEAPMAWIEALFGTLAAGVSGLWPIGSTSALRSLLVDGVIAGVGGVLVFLPNILLLFFGLALLEDTGYMARAAFLMDRLMHRFGLHGKSFLPMMTGFGCSVPGIMATRTLDSERDRLTTMLVLPLMSCGARLPIWLLLVPAFFAPSWRAPMLWSIYAVGIVLALLLALLLRRSVLKGEDSPFVMELPPYRVPTVRGVAMKMFDRGWLYARKAGTVILGLSILMWVLTTYPKLDHFAVDEAIAAGRVAVVDQAAHEASPLRSGAELITPHEADARRAGEALRHSAAGRIGRFLEPAVAPLGFDWKISTALVGALAAKEVFVAQMGIVYSLGEADEKSFELRSVLHRDYSPLVGLSLMLFLLISAPCIATIALTRRESGSWRWAALQFGGLSAIAYLVALLVFQVGRVLGFA